MKFLIDQNIKNDLASTLRENTVHEANTLHDFGLERATDPEVFTWCRMLKA